MMRSEEFANELKKKIISMAEICKKGEGYWGGYMSLVDILAVLYCDVMNLSNFNNDKNMCDKLILSKGHSGLALYCAMNLRGILDDADLKLYGKSWSGVTQLASYNSKLGIELSGGSLGLGLAYGSGLALLGKKIKHEYRTYVILGDGEIQEGANWETAFFCNKYHLNNLVAIVDNNKFQSDGSCMEIMPVDSLKEKFESFGWCALEIDGHSHEQLKAALTTVSTKPIAIIANTIKGHGISFMENNNAWHHAKLVGDMLELAKKELSGD